MGVFGALMGMTVLKWEKFLSNDCRFHRKIMGMVFSHVIPDIIPRMINGWARARRYFVVSGTATNRNKASGKGDNGN
jgi:hypothetical protein